jgi:hypothetical protein
MAWAEAGAPLFFALTTLFEFLDQARTVGEVSPGPLHLGLASRGIDSDHSTVEPPDRGDTLPAFVGEVGKPSITVGRLGLWHAGYPGVLLR